jgi:hypothetical protein
LGDQPGSSLLDEFWDVYLTASASFTTDKLMMITVRDSTDGSHTFLKNATNFKKA